MIRILAILTVVTIVGCSKAGLDGSTTVVATLRHHDVVVGNQAQYPDTVFVLLNESEPDHHGAEYDAFFVGTPGTDNVVLSNLKPGCYYLFGVGLDTAINERVEGGIALRIKPKDKDETIYLDIPITEH